MSGLFNLTTFSPLQTVAKVPLSLLHDFTAENISNVPAEIS
jgi:hypothetical protein